MYSLDTIPTFVPWPSLTTYPSFQLLPGVASAWKELLRGCRMHFNRLVKDLSENDLDKARLGLGHAFSRHRMQLDPNRQEKPQGWGIRMIWGNFRWVMWVPESCYLVSCLGPSYGFAQCNVLLKDRDWSPMLWVYDYPSKDWAWLPRD